MCIRGKEKKSGKTVKTIKAGSNFTFKPIVQVVGPKNGYIILIKVFCSKAERWVLSSWFYSILLVKGQ